MTVMEWNGMNGNEKEWVSFTILYCRWSIFFCQRLNDDVAMYGQQMYYHLMTSPAI